jgi:hypothetical protein
MKSRNRLESSMPAIITHDTFGQDLYREMYEIIGESRDEFEAFLLGNQGPDPLFYCLADPRLRAHKSLGSTMHSNKPNELLFALKRSYSILDDQNSRIGRAYALGFLCHYLLDSNMHPLVYSQEYELCDEDVEEFSKDDAKAIHAVIESEFDEMVLFNRYGKTIASFDPSKEILRASDAVLATVSKMYVYMAMVVYGRYIPANMFTNSLKLMRLGMGAFRSRTGIKRNLIGRAEELFKPYSLYKTMSPRDIELTESIFENRSNAPWENPFTGEESTESFWNIFEAAQEKARGALRLLDSEDFSIQKAEEITHDLDFSGNPTVAVLIVEDEPAS